MFPKWTTRDIFIFLAGAEAFHTLSHVLINVSGTLPITFFNITWTQQLNLLAIIINGAITIGLLIWAARIK
jgi:hypothetical protein